MSNQLISKKIESYKVFLKEHSRPPSRGGNTKALHAHVLEIEGERYSFLAFGSQQWVFKADTVTFEFEVTADGYKNVLTDTLRTADHKGNVVVRGSRGTKRLRTAPSRLPSSRREQRD